MKSAVYIALVALFASLFITCSFADEQNPDCLPTCDSASVNWVIQTQAGTCGSNFTALLSTTGPCQLSSGGSLVCDSNIRNCVECNYITTTSAGLLFDCEAIGTSGTQIITATYMLGDLTGTIATAYMVTCSSPFATPVPVSIPIPTAPSTCDSSSVSLVLNGPCFCGEPFTATLSTDGPCDLSSGGALVCNGDGVDCQSCSVIPNSDSSLTYECTALASGGPQIVTGTYQLGTLIGTIARTAMVNCEV